MLDYFTQTRLLHKYQKFSLDGAMASTPNTKQLQAVSSTDDAASKLAMQDYYKYRAANLMFGFNAGIISTLASFCEFNALRKNQLLGFYAQLEDALSGTAEALTTTSQSISRLLYVPLYGQVYMCVCRLSTLTYSLSLDFMPQFEIGQQQLVDVHHYFYLLDLYAITDGLDTDLIARIHTVNDLLVNHVYFSTQRPNNYEKMVSTKEFLKSKQSSRHFRNAFMTIDFFRSYIGLGFAEINPKEKDINSLTQTVFYLYDLARSLANKQSYEFEKECINQMARSNNRHYVSCFVGGQESGADVQGQHTDWHWFHVLQVQYAHALFECRRELLEQS